MPLTNFPHGITTGGVPVYGSAGGFPHTSGGAHFFVDSVNGSDSADGRSWEKAKASIFGTNGGYSLLTSDRNEVLHVIGGATAYAETAVGTWAHDYTHMVGETAGIMTGGRVRLTNTVQTATVGEFVISGTGCVFSGIHWQHGGSAIADSVVGVSITGGNGRNQFINCHFEGPVNATLAAGTAIHPLRITASEDNCFLGCAFGANTILSSSAAGSVVHFAGENSNRNVFKDCIFFAYNSETTSATISYADNAMSDAGWTLFDNCVFQECAGTNSADVIRYTTDGHGSTILKDCTLTGTGAATWCTSAWKTHVEVCAAVCFATGGLGIHPG